MHESCRSSDLPLQTREKLIQRLLQDYGKSFVWGVPQSGALQFVACCSVLYCVAVGCSVMQRDAVCCSELQCVLRCVSVFCSVLQCDAVFGSLMQYVAVCCSVL